MRNLKSFIAVAEEGSFTLAARRLHIAQPPLSYRIRQLEESIGVKLFERTTRSVTLTAAGRVYFERVKPALAAIEQATQESKRVQLGELGVLRIGYTGRASQGYLPSLLNRFRMISPNVALDLHGPRPTGVLASDLLEGAIDAALCFLPLNNKKITSRLLLESKFLIALPNMHPLAQRDTLQLSDLRAEPFVAYPAGQGFHLRQATDQICMAAGFLPNVVRETEASQTLLCLVAAGIGISIIPSDLEPLSIEGVVFKDIPNEQYRLQHGLAWLKANNNPALGQLLKISQ